MGSPIRPEGVPQGFIGSNGQQILLSERKWFLGDFSLVLVDSFYVYNYNCRQMKGTVGGKCQY